MEDMGEGVIPRTEQDRSGASDRPSGKPVVKAERGRRDVGGDEHLSDLTKPSAGAEQTEYEEEDRQTKRERDQDSNRDQESGMSVLVITTRIGIRIGTEMRMPKPTAT